MKLPDVTPLSQEALSAIATRHGLHFDRAEVLAPAGIINTVYAVSAQHVLRIPRGHSAHAEQARREAAAIPAARAEGVQTPRLIAFDDARDLLPVPYLVVERASGVNLESLGIAPPAPSEAWLELGRQLGRLHAVPRHGPVADLGLAPTAVGGDPRPLVERQATDGWISPHEAHWLLRWLDRLAPLASGGTGADCFLHGDVQMSNLLVDPDDGTYRTLLDWGCAGWGDPTADFLAIPMRAVPLLLMGHRDVAPVEGGDDTAEARILWRRLHMIFSVMPRGAAAGTSWGERPIAWLVDLLGFFLDRPHGWRDLAPA